MACSSLDTRAWNLGALALGVGGCGPLVALPSDTDGDEDDESDDEGRPDTTDSTPTSTTPGDCDPECPPGYTCVYGYCQYDCNSCCDGECGGYYECFSHEECGGGNYCSYYSCAAIAYLYNCPAGFSFLNELIPNVGNAVALAFADVDADGFDDLVIVPSEAIEAQLVRGPDGSAGAAIDLFGTPTGVVATDVDGASPTELTFAFSDSDMLIVMSAVFDPVPMGTGEPSLLNMVGADLDADGLDDVVGLRNGAIAGLFSNGSSFENYSEFGFFTSSTIAAGELGPTAGADVVWSDGLVYVGEVFEGGGSSVVLDELYGFTGRTPMVGDFDGNGIEDVAAISPDAGGYYGVITTWNNIGGGAFARNPYVVGPELHVTVDGVFANAVGDFNADGAEDIVIAGDLKLSILFGTPAGGASFSCWVDLAINGSARHMAAGDFDGNGFDDIAWSDGVTTRILLSG